MASVPESHGGGRTPPLEHTRSTTKGEALAPACKASGAGALTGRSSPSSADKGANGKFYPTPAAAITRFCACPCHPSVRCPLTPGPTSGHAHAPSPCAHAGPRSSAQGAEEWQGSAECARLEHGVIRTVSGSAAEINRHVAGCAVCVSEV